MTQLSNLYQRLNNSTYCRYGTNKAFPVIVEGQATELIATELLEVGRDTPREHVSIACFTDKPTRIVYIGEDADSMRHTLEQLRLPNSRPSNLGEKVFYAFRAHLRPIQSGHVHLEQEVAHGKEEQLEGVLKRLIAVYESSAQFQCATN